MQRTGRRQDNIYASEQNFGKEADNLLARYCVNYIHATSSESWKLA
jgi:hypothetical protein